jgi:hypothetical protein
MASTTPNPKPKNKWPAQFPMLGWRNHSDTFIVCLTHASLNVILLWVAIFVLIGKVFSALLR